MPAAQPANGLRSGSPYAMAGALVCIALVLVAEWQGLPVPDVSWLLYVTAQVAKGAEYGVDLIDVSPPPIIWYSLPSAWMTRYLPMSAWHAFIVSLVVTGGAALGLVWAICRRCSAWGSVFRDRLLAAAAVSLLALPWGVFGEREHLALMLVLPYVVLFGARDAEATPQGWLSVATGAMAGFGFAIKPYFALPWALIALAASWCRRGKPIWSRPEFIAASATSVACVLLVLWREPGYVAYMREFGPYYLDYVRNDPLFVVLKGEANGAAVVLVTLVAALVLRGDVPPSARGACFYLATAAAGFYLGAALQLKGWRYHYLPGVALSFLALTVLVGGRRQRVAGKVVRLYRSAALATVAVLLGDLVLTNTLRLYGSETPTFDPHYERLLAVVTRDGGGRPLAVLSSNLASVFPLTTEAGVETAMRFGGIQPWLPAFYADQIQSGKVVHPRPVEGRLTLERRLGELVVSDLRRLAPGLILLPTPEDGPYHYRLFDYLAYFMPLSGFKEFLAEYRPVGTVGIYLVLQHRTLAGQNDGAGWREPPVPARPAAPFSDWAERLLLLLAAVVSLVGFRQRGRSTA